jgi:hypothetical protein
MAINDSNLYAAKIFAEHPLSLWTLDDDFSFINLLEEEYQNPNNWNSNNTASVSLVSIPSGEYIKQSPVYAITRTASSPFITELELPNSFSQSESLDDSKNSICINLFIYATSKVDKYEIGFEYDLSGSTVYNSREFDLPPSQWHKISHTFQIESPLIELTPKIKIKYYEEDEGDGVDYRVLFNGMSVGQWSEGYNRVTDGSQVFEMPSGFLRSNLPFTTKSIKTFPIDPYGLSSIEDGYYIVDDNKMLAVNTSLPMVFGARNVTEIKSPKTEKMPGVVFPSKGFLSGNAKYLDITAEFWLRVATNSKNQIKIFGPLRSSNGLYVEEDYITLKVGQYEKSYFIGKWDRPMLVDIRYSRNNASVLINGDLVIDMQIDFEQILFPTREEDWVGFFGYENVYIFDIDAFAIYPYLVPEQMAKRRFVYAQGVDPTEQIVESLGGESFYFDFPFSNYATTISYPDNTSWNSGFFSNMSSNSRFLSFPEYGLPELRLVNVNLEDINISTENSSWNEIYEGEWQEILDSTWNVLLGRQYGNFFEDNYYIQNEDHIFLSLKPGPDEVYGNTYGSIYFNNLSILNNAVKSVFAVFKSPEVLDSEKQVLMAFTSNLTTNIFKVTISDAGIEYFYNDFLLQPATPIQPETNFVAGINLERINTVVKNFFSNPQNISLNIAGFEENVFKGKIYSVTFNNSMYTNMDLPTRFNDIGVITNQITHTPSGTAYDKGIDFLEYVGNYTLFFKESGTEVGLDIASSGYWEDAIPLSYFGKIVKDEFENDYYDLDLMQFNIDSPSIAVNTSNLEDAFELKTYVTLQPYQDVGKRSYRSYNQTVKIGPSRVLDFQKYSFTQLLNTKFEVADNTVIFPPKGAIDFEQYYIVFHIEVKSIGLLSKPLRLQRMSMSSLAYDQTSRYELGTRTGNKIIPFTRDNQQRFYNKDKNPFIVGKDSVPYLYLSATSGFSVLPYETDKTRGVYLPINDRKSPEYKLGGIQIWTMFNKNYQFDEVVKMGQIREPSSNKGIYLYPEIGGKRAEIKIIDDTTNEDVTEDFSFFQNGIDVERIYLEPLEWTTILISYKNSPSLESLTGRLELYEGFVFNNIAFYQESRSNVVQVVKAERDWAHFSNETWEYWVNTSYITGFFKWIEFGGIEIIEQTQIEGGDLFESYLGLSKITTGDPSVLSIDSDGVDIITAARWQQYSGKPV